MKPDSPEPPRAESVAAGTDSERSMRTTLERRLDGAEARGAPCAPPVIPDHVLLHRIGSGAYGEVWLARSALGTLRAVKIIYRASFEDERPYDREFQGILKYEPISRTHEGLVQVLHVGRNDEAGCFYYVMELADDANDECRMTNVERPAEPSAKDFHSSFVIRHSEFYVPRTIRSELRKQQRLAPTDAAQLALRLAGALAHLHSHGLVHRDIKPSNVIFVGGHPKLADVGLVAGAGDSRSFVGTEGFIPPEGPGTVAADVYSLGKLLYELATGRDRLDFPQLPPGVGQLPDGEALLELNEVMTRACAPEPQQRYASATEMQAELNLFLAGRSLRQARNLERTLSRLKRFAVAACVFLALAAGIVWFAKNEEYHARERAREANERARIEAGNRAKESALRQRAEAAEHEQSRLREDAQKAQADEARSRRKAEAQELAARKKAYASDMNLLQQALAADGLGRAQELLDRQRPGPGEVDMRGWEWRYFWQFCQSDAAFTLCQRSNSIISVSFSSDGALLAVGTYLGHEVTVWDVATRRMIFRHEGDSSPRVAFAPSGDTLAFYNLSNDQRSVVLWNSRARTEVRRLPLNGAVRDLAFTRDGRLFTADAGRSNNITLWDVASGNVVTNFTARVPTYAMGTVFSVTGDGNRFVYAMQNPSHSVRVMDAKGRRDQSIRVADELTTALAFSPDGEVLVTGAGYAEGAVKLWDVPTHQLIGSLEGHRSWVSSLKFLPDGRTLASASADRTIRLWDFETRQPIRTLRGHSGELWTMDVSPDGRWLASGGKDGSVILWDLTSSTNRPPVYRTLPVSGAGWWYYSPDGRWLGVIHEKRLKLYAAKTLQLVSEPALTLTNITGMAFSPDMGLLVVTDAQGNLGVWDLPGQRMVTNFVAHLSAASLTQVFVSNGKSVLTYGAENVFKEWDVATWKEIRQWPIAPGLASWGTCPAANLIATGTRAGWIELIPIQDPEQRRRFTGQTRIKTVELAPDGKTLVAASENGTVEFWDTETLTRTALLHGVLLGYHSVTISPDGERVAAGSNGQEAIKLWDLHSHEEVATLAGQGSFFVDAAFSPDGNTIGARNWKGVLHFWTAPSWKQIEAAETGRGTISP